jgi:hypothetical protein
MKKYIFLSYFAEKFENLDKSSTSGLTIIEWENPQNAFKNLRKSEEFEHIGHSWDTENYICYELVDWKMTEFNIK